MNAGKTILIIDDDLDLGRSLGDLLKLHEDIDTASAETATSALKTLETRHFDAILLDVRLPDMDGRDVCRLLRRRGVRIPIVMLTVVDSDADIILGLNAGANDYITKPFRPGILRARLRAQLREDEHSDYAVLTVGPYRFHPDTKLLIDTESSRRTRLSEKEAAILRRLLDARGRVVPRQVLLLEALGYGAGVTTHTLETHVYRLRQKIESNPSKPTLLLTGRGGYRLVR